MNNFVGSLEHKGMGLKVRDEDFMWSKIIGDTPTDKVIREVFQNTIENPGTCQVISGEMKIEGMIGKKFFMINDGTGINDITKLENLFGSDKNPTRELNGNNNTGVRLMGAAANKLGMAFITKYSNKISAFFMRRPNEKSYNVEIYYLDDKFNPYELMKDYGKQFNISGDWTMVICLGETSEQNTYRQPDYKSDFVSKDAVETYITNRYFDRPTSMKEGIIPLDITIGNKKITFLKEELNKIKGEDFVFETNIAKYTVKYSETFGKYVPKCAIVFENELFDLRADGLIIKNLVGDSKNFMTNIGAYNLRSKLSVMVEPSKNLEARMDNYRTNIIVDANEFHKGTSRLTLNDFVKDFIENSPESLKELIQSSNPNHKVNISQKNIDRLLKALNGRYKNSKGMTIKKDKKILDDLELIKRELEIEYINNIYFEDLLKKFPLVPYNLINESISLSMEKEQLKNSLEIFMKLVKSNIRDVIKHRDTFNSLIINLYNLSIKYNTVSIKNVFEDMINLNKQDIQNTELLEAYQMVLKVFLKHLKHDISEKNKDSNDDNNESKNPNREITPLELCLKTAKEWNIDHINVENKDNTFAFYTENVLIINKDDQDFKDLKNRIELLCFENNVKTEIADEVLMNTLSLFGGFLSTFKIITDVENLNLLDDERFDHQLRQSGETFASHTFNVEQMIIEELYNNINEIKCI